MSERIPSTELPGAADGRAGRPFTLRLTPTAEETLRRGLAALQLLPHDDRPKDLFGFYGHRQPSFGGYVVWAALATAAPVRPGSSRAVRPARRRPGKTKKGGRK